MAEQSGGWTRRTVPPVAMVIALAVALGIGVGTPLWLAHADRGAADPRPAAIRMQVRQLPSFYWSKMTAATMSSTGVVAVGTEAGDVVMLDVRRNAIPLGGLKAGAAVSLLAFSEDGSTLAVATRDGAVLAWTFGPGELRAHRWQPGFKYGVSALGLSADGRLLAVAGFEVAVYDTRTGRKLRTPQEPKDPQDGSVVRGQFQTIAFSADSTTLLGGSSAGVDVWNLASGAVLRSLRFLCGEFGLSATARFLTCGSAGHVVVMELGDEQIVGEQTVSRTAVVVGTDATPDGRRVFASTTAGELVAWDRSADTVVARAQLPTKARSKDARTYARISLTDDATALLAVDVSGDPGNLWLVTLR